MFDFRLQVSHRAVAIATARDVPALNRFRRDLKSTSDLFTGQLNLGRPLGGNGSSCT